MIGPIILMLGGAMLISVVSAWEAKRDQDRETECKVYIQGHYLEHNCWKGDTMVYLRIR